MKGTWIYDEKADIWHLLWDGRPWCKRFAGSDWPDLNWPDKEGAQIAWSDTLHDACARKSEELDG